MDLRDIADTVGVLAVIGTVVIVKPWHWITGFRTKERAELLAATATLIAKATDPIIHKLQRVEDRQETHIEDHKAGDARLERIEHRIERVDDDLHDVVIRRQVEIAKKIGIDGEE